MLKLLTPTLILFLLTLGACSKDKTPQPSGNNNVVLFLPEFSGYTATDNVGSLTGVTDTTDWRLDDQWTAAEEELFDNYTTYTVGCPADTNLSIHPAFPNPTGGLFTLIFTKDSATRVDLRIVDQADNILVTADSIYSNAIQANVTGLTGSDSLARVYYLFIKNDSCAYAGHGDIRIN
jgi:hypothetical protein